VYSSSYYFDLFLKYLKTPMLIHVKRSIRLSAERGIVVVVVVVVVKRFIVIMVTSNHNQAEYSKKCSLVIVK